MKKYLLDTNICIHYLKNEFNIPQKIFDVGVKNCFISELTVMELLYGAARGNEQNKEKNMQNAYSIENTIFKNRVLPIRFAFEHYAIEKAKLKSTGGLIGEIDTLIAATSLATEMILVTRNVKHFEKNRRINNRKLDRCRFIKTQKKHSFQKIE